MIQIERAVPTFGRVHILSFTDRQFENIVRLDGRKRERTRKNPEQFVLF